MVGYVVSALVGWLIGGLANWAADILPPLNDPEQRGRAPVLLHDWSLAWFPWRGRRCPHCDTPPGPRRPLLELGMILLFLFWWRLYPDRPVLLLVAWLYSAFLLLVLVIDLEHRRVLNLMTVPAALIILGASFLPFGPSPTDALLGGAAGYTLFLFIHLVGGRRLGLGDVKLAGVIGLMVGYPLVITVLLIAMILGAFGGLLLLVTRRAGRRDYMAYAPYMSLAALMSLILTFASGG